MKLGLNFEVGKNRLVAGSDPILSGLCRPKSPGLPGSLPATFGLVADSPNSFCHAICSGQSLTKRFLFHTEDRDAFA
jgi:hypothetical protein